MHFTNFFWVCLLLLLTKYCQSSSFASIFFRCHTLIVFHNLLSIHDKVSQCKKFLITIFFDFFLSFNKKNQTNASKLKTANEHYLHSRLTDKHITHINSRFISNYQQVRWKYAQLSQFFILNNFCDNKEASIHRKTTLIMKIITVPFLSLANSLNCCDYYHKTCVVYFHN